MEKNFAKNLAKGVFFFSLSLGFFFSFHTGYFTCFNAILPNLPTLSLSHRVLKTVLYISVSFAVSYTGLLLGVLKSQAFLSI